MTGGDVQGLAVAARGFVEPSQLPQRVAEVAQRRNQVRLQRECPAVASGGLVQTAQPEPDIAQVDVRLDEAGLQ